MILSCFTGRVSLPSEAFNTQQQELVGLDVPRQLAHDSKLVWPHVVRAVIYYLEDKGREED